MSYAVDVAEKVEESLAAHPRFADAVRIQRGACSRYEFIAELLGNTFPVLTDPAATLLSECGPGVWRDPLIRRALEDGLACLTGASADASGVAGILGMAAEPAVRSSELMPCEQEDGRPLRAGPDGMIWLPPARPAVASQRLRRLRGITAEIIELNGLRDAEFHSPQTSHAAAIDRGVLLLSAALPRLSQGVLSHIVAVSLLSGRSAEGRQLSAAGGVTAPGVIFVDPSLLDSAWMTAATLLHEGLHLRAFDIERSTVLVADPDRQLEIPWRHHRWHISRVLFAFHVYVHLVLFEAAARARAEELAAGFGTPPESVTAIGRARDYGPADVLARTRYLGDQLAGPLAGALTADGRRFVNWLLESSQPLVGGQPGVSRRPDRPGLAASPLGAGPLAGEAKYVHVTGARVKAVPELAMAFAYSPSRRRLSFLNLAAWAVFELCDGRLSPASAYRELVESKMPASQAGRQLSQAIALLTAEGLIEEVKGGESC